MLSAWLECEPQLFFRSVIVVSSIYKQYTGTSIGLASRPMTLSAFFFFETGYTHVDKSSSVQITVF